MSSIGSILSHHTVMTNPFAQPTPADSSTGGTSGTSDSSGSTPSNELTGDSFIQLLTAQLQAQDPLNPVDPTTFVTQLVQFNQLEQLIQINSTLTGDVATPSTGAATSNAIVARGFTPSLAQTNSPFSAI